jgi:hypothetical protein
MYYVMRAFCGLIALIFVLGCVGVDRTADTVGGSGGGVSLISLQDVEGKMLERLDARAEEVIEDELESSFPGDSRVSAEVSALSGKCDFNRSIFLSAYNREFNASRTAGLEYCLDDDGKCLKDVFTGCDDFVLVDHRPSGMAAYLVNMSSDGEACRSVSLTPIIIKYRCFVGECNDSTARQRLTEECDGYGIESDFEKGLIRCIGETAKYGLSPSMLESIPPINATRTRVNIELECGISDEYERAYARLREVEYSWRGDRYVAEGYGGSRDALLWLRQNTAEDARVLSWWDNGHDIQAVSGREAVLTTPSKEILDTTTDPEYWRGGNSTLDNGPLSGHDTVRDVALALTSTDPETTHNISKRLNAGYILVVDRDERMVTSIRAAAIADAGGVLNLTAAYMSAVEETNSSSVFMRRALSGGQIPGFELVYQDKSAHIYRAVL